MRRLFIGARPGCVGLHVGLALRHVSRLYRLIGRLRAGLRQMLCTAGGGSALTMQSG